MAREGSDRAGVSTYSIPASDFIIIDNTVVEPAFEGKGVGKQLLDKIVEIAREKKIKILPLCPYANSMFKKLADIQDVFFFSSRRRHTRWTGDWSSDVCSSDLNAVFHATGVRLRQMPLRLPGKARA